MNYLHDGLLELGFTEEKIALVEEKLFVYLRELQLFNNVMDLVGADSTDDIVIRHILDSLSAINHLTDFIHQIQANHDSSYVVRIADVGSGGGLPGIPLAVAFPNVNFTLIERMSKRTAFLENCVALMGLKNVTVYNKSVEECSSEKWDIVTFRAFRPLDKKMTKSLLSLRGKDGLIVAYKAKSDKIKLEMDAISAIVPTWKQVSLCVPFLPEVERNLVVF